MQAASFSGDDQRARSAARDTVEMIAVDIVETRAVQFPRRAAVAGRQEQPVSPEDVAPFRRFEPDFERRVGNAVFDGELGIFERNLGIFQCPLRFLARLVRRGL